MTRSDPAAGGPAEGGTAEGGTAEGSTAEGSTAPGNQGRGRPVPGGAAPADALPALPDDFAELVGELSEETSPARQRRLMGRMTGLAARGGRASWAGLAAGSRAGWAGIQFSGRWLTAQAIAMAPRLPVRSQQRLREQFPGLGPDELADALILGASRAAASVGATVGAAMLLPLPAAPVEIAAETLALVGIEIKLVAELHEVYGQRAPGSAADRMLAYLAAWSQRRGVSLVPGGLALAVGSPLRRQLQRRLLARAGRSALSLGPLLTGAAAGAMLNRRETRRLGHEIRDDLRRRSAPGAGWPS
jgi:hypothetical protein